MGFLWWGDDEPWQIRRLEVDGEAILSAARSLETVAGLAGGAGRRLTACAGPDVWSGEVADRFRRTVEPLISTLSVAELNLGTAAGLLRDLQPRLVTHRENIANLRQAFHRIDADHDLAVAAARAHGLPDPPPPHDATQRILDAAAEIRTEHQRSLLVLGQALEAARDQAARATELASRDWWDRNIEPHLRGALESRLGFLGPIGDAAAGALSDVTEGLIWEFGSGLVQGVISAADLAIELRAWEVIPLSPDTAARRFEFGRSLVSGIIEDPGSLLDAVLSIDVLREEGVFVWLGAMAPEAVLAIASMGSSTAVTRGAQGSRVISRVAGTGARAADGAQGLLRTARLEGVADRFGEMSEIVRRGQASWGERADQLTDTARAIDDLRSDVIRHLDREYFNRRLTRGDGNDIVRTDGDRFVIERADAPQLHAPTGDPGRLRPDPQTRTRVDARLDRLEVEVEAGSPVERLVQTVRDSRLRGGFGDGDGDLRVDTIRPGDSSDDHLLALVGGDGDVGVLPERLFHGRVDEFGMLEVRLADGSYRRISSEDDLRSTLGLPAERYGGGGIAVLEPSRPVDVLVGPAGPVHGSAQDLTGGAEQLVLRREDLRHLDVLNVVELTTDASGVFRPVATITDMATSGNRVVSAADWLVYADEMSDVDAA